MSHYTIKLSSNCSCKAKLVKSSFMIVFSKTIISLALVGYEMIIAYLPSLDRPKGRTVLSTLGARSFYASAPTLWNSLPANIT